MASRQSSLSFLWIHSKMLEFKLLSKEKAANHIDL